MATNYQPASRPRLWLAFLVAPLAPVILNAIVLWPAFTIAIVVGLISAYVLTAVFGIPFVSLMRRLNYFKPWPIVVAAGVLAAIPDLAITVVGVGIGGMTTLTDGSANYLVQDGHLTWRGIVHFLLVRPLAYWSAGAIGGLVFWLIAVGPFAIRGRPAKAGPA